MSAEIRKAALELAIRIHQDADSVVKSAKAFFDFISGGETQDAAPAARGRGRPAKGETSAVASDPSAAAAAATPASSAAIAAVTTAPVPAGLEGTVPVTITVTLQKVADAIIDLANNHSRDTAVAILKANGASKVPELKPESFAKVLAETLAAIAASKAAKEGVPSNGLT